MVKTAPAKAAPAKAAAGSPVKAAAKGMHKVAVMKQHVSFGKVKWCEVRECIVCFKQLDACRSNAGVLKWCSETGQCRQCSLESCGVGDVVRCVVSGKLRTAEKVQCLLCQATGFKMIDDSTSSGPSTTCRKCFPRVEKMYPKLKKMWFKRNTDGKGNVTEPFPGRSAICRGEGLHPGEWWSCVAFNEK